MDRGIKQLPMSIHKLKDIFVNIQQLFLLTYGCVVSVLIDEQNHRKYKDGRIFKGNWKDGRMHGSGQMQLLNGSIVQAIWNNGKMSRRRPSMMISLEEFQKNMKISGTCSLSK